jgi:hypothetical protein
MQIAGRRLSAQLIAGGRFGRPDEVVAWLGALQAQDEAASRWAVGLRLAGAGARQADVERSLASGELLRLHLFRGTWQLVARADARWMLGLVAPHLEARFATRYAQLGLDAATRRKSLAALGRALAGGDHLTRAELAAALDRSGISSAGQRLPYLLGHAELAGLIASGAPRGRQATYARLDERAPGPGEALEGEAARAELARRYFRSRGPATFEDFQTWSGLPAADARSGLQAVERALTARALGGRRYWQAAGIAPARASRTAYLLPAFDEYLVGYRHRDPVLDPRHARRLNAGGGMLAPAIVLDGQVIGTWRRTPARGQVVLELDLFEPPAARRLPALRRAADRYAAFLGQTAEVTFARPGRRVLRRTPGGSP